MPCALAACGAGAAAAAGVRLAAGWLGVGRLQRILGAAQIQPRALHVVGGGESGCAARYCASCSMIGCGTHHAGRRRRADL